jgi:hypothetical protein
MSFDTRDIIFPDELESAARALIQRAADEYDERYGFGSMSTAIYDTDWVSLVAKIAEYGRQRAFPECFGLLLDSQLGEGAWGPSTSQVDGLLNPAASVIAARAS